MDMLLATGEQISIALMAMAIQSLGEPAISFTGAQIGIVTDSFHTKARIKNISTQRMRDALVDGKIVKSGGADLASHLEEHGYDWIVKEPAAVKV